MMWTQDEATKEWSLIPINSHAIAEAVVVENDDDDDDATGAAGADTNTDGKSDESEDDNAQYAKAVMVEELDKEGAKAFLSSSKNDAAARQHIEYHVDEDKDTFQGICLRYKVTSTELRRANCFSGSNLKLAPVPLKIPLNSKNHHMKDNVAAPRKAITRQEAVQNLVRACGCKISGMEAKAYLELNEWDYEQSLQNARDDLKYEQMQSMQVADMTKGRNQLDCIRKGEKASLLSCCW
mmetsp:Transcript_5201/g.14001  ORF Transcript_5201/g.14001 Transcript_5201/m.14001 type:complete len:238 (-) Transcript_5201:548-1261(-)|eukprot:CAMPEP_0198113742 /NCGR_PEP_ID=MMETSP1442-20131203/5331_1 /TAXON_ID= /ORGANISM="Craspedostauros australis, Strain CCMP3328" /LENGTH=237 /DNA_ID=CAMNT_0043770913 /DNA_START=298 /DNA_END=1011 /DNA_ORIENTATION=+